jgi:hypothetical protein
MRLGPYFEEGGASGTVEATPAPAETPRDPQTGRFSKANIERVAAMAPEGNVPRDTPEAAASATPAAPAVPETPVPVAPATEDPMTAVEAFLAANPDTVQAPATPVATAAPAPQTPELQQVQQWLSNPQQAAEAVQQVRVYSQLAHAANRGDVDGVFSTFAPQFTEAIKEHLFQKHREEFAQRIVDEGNGIKRDPVVGTLQQQVNALTQYIQSQQQQGQTYLQQQQEQQATAALNQKLGTFMDGLYKSAGLKDNPNLAWLDGRLRSEIQMNPQAQANIRAGRFGDIGVKFRELYKQFQPLLTATAAQPQAAAQPGSTQLMTTAAGASTTSTQPEKLATPDGGLNTRAFAARLKSMLKAV